MRLLPALAMLVAASMAPASAAAATPAAEDDGSKASIDVHGFYLASFGVGLGGERPAGADSALSLGESRLRLDGSFTSPSSRTRAHLRGDLDLDVVAGGISQDVREAYVAHRAGRLDASAGRQIVTWGIGDLFFISDVFPKDWESFFAGRPMEYLKLGVDGARGRLSLGGVAMDVLVIPTFTPDRLPSADRFVFTDPLGGLPVHLEEPRPGLGDTEWALRLQHKAGPWRLSWCAYRGYWRAPAVRVDDPATAGSATGTYPELAVVGASLEGSLLGGLWGLEAGYYDSREDRAGDDPATPNSQARVLVNYQVQPWRDLTLLLQVYAERMARHHDYEASLPPGARPRGAWTSVASGRLTWPLRYGTWRLSCFAAWGIESRDSLVRPEVSHPLSDQLTFSLGANVIGGPGDATPFGWLSASDSVFASVRFDF